VLTGGAWIFYFADAPTLMVDVVTLQAPFIAYATIALFTATTYTFGGLLREQVCIYMCPWPRIQGAMLDEHSLTVTYNDWRGEPHTRHAKRAIAEGKPVGDCVDCNACVVVCPMGIDIRDGQQLECITCALCIDACDDVMTRLGKERGLISYATLSDYNRNMELATGSGKVVQPARVRNAVTGRLVDAIKHTDWRSVIRPRTIVYLIGWSAIGLAMLTALALRSPLSLNVLHDRNPLYVELRDGAVSNGYDVKILNMTPELRDVVLRLEGLPGSALSEAEGKADMVQSLELSLQPDKVLPLRLYIRVGADALPPSQARFQIVVEDKVGGIERRVESTFEVPEKRR